MYSQVAATIAADIRAGRYKIGSKLPTEAVLQRMFQVSRHTIREALRELRDSGYIATQHGIGTTVLAQTTSYEFIQNATQMDDLVAFSKTTHMQVLGSDRVLADAALASFLGGTTGQAWAKVTLLRFSGDKESDPIGLLRVYVRPEHEGVASFIEERQQPVFMLVEELFGVRISHMEQEIASITFDAQTLSQLGSSSTYHGLRITRRFFDSSNRLVQATLGFYPANQLVYTSRVEIRRQVQG